MVMIVTMATHTTLTTESPSPTTKQPTISSMPQRKRRLQCPPLHRPQQKARTMITVITTTQLMVTITTPGPMTKQPTISSMPQRKRRRLLQALHSRLQVTWRLLLPLSFSCRHVLFHSRDEPHLHNTSHHITSHHTTPHHVASHRSDSHTRAIKEFLW